MRRTSVMAMGFVLIFIGVQLNLVEQYTLTPRFSNFLSEQAAVTPGQNNRMINPVNPANRMVPSNGSMNPSNGFSNQNITPSNSPFAQASFPNQNNGSLMPQRSVVRAYGLPKVVRPPSWICWPVLFLGTVVFLHGFSMRRDY